MLCGALITWRLTRSRELQARQTSVSVFDEWDDGSGAGGKKEGAAEDGALSVACLVACGL